MGSVAGRLPVRPASPGDRLRAAVAVAVLLAIVVAVPAALVTAVGSPLPGWAGGRVLTGALEAGPLLRLLSLVVWLAWAHFVVCLLVELRAERAGAGLTARVPLGGPSQALARRLIAATLLLAGTAAVALPAWTAPAWTAPTATASVVPAAPARVGATIPPAVAEPVVLYDVRPPAGRHYDTLWEIAERFLGAGPRYKEIVALNLGRPQPDGRALEQPDLIRPGWIMQLPADARGPGLRTVTPPSSGRVPSPGPGLPVPGPGLPVPPSPVPAAPIPTAPATTAPATTAPATPAPVTPAPSPSGVTVPPAPVPSITPTATPSAPDCAPAGAVPGAAATRTIPPPTSPPPARPAPTGPAPAGTPAAGTPAAVPPAGRTAPEPDGARFPTPQQGLAGAGLLAAGLAVALRRRRAARGLAGAGGRAAETEASLRLAATGSGATFLDHALRGLVAALDATGRQRPGLVAARLDEERLTLYLTPAETVPPPAPWTATADGGSWTLPRTARPPVPPGPAPGPYPGLVAFGTTDGGQILLDLAAAPGPVSVGGDPGQAHDVVVAVAVELATNCWSDGLQVCVVGFAEDLTALAPARLRHARSVADAAGTRTSRGAGTQVVVLAAPPTAADLAALAGRPPLAVLVAGDVPTARWRFTVTAAGRLSTGVLGIDLAARTLPERDRTPLVTLFATPDAAPPPAPSPLPPPPNGRAEVEVLVLGPVVVHAGGPLEPARSAECTEIVAFVALHPQGVHRSVLAGALWPQGVADDVRDDAIARSGRWVGTDPGGRPHLVAGADGRLRLGPGVRCDWDVLRTRLTRAAQPGAAGRAELTEALRLPRGPLWEDLPDHRYSWLARTAVEAESRTAVVGAARRLAALCRDAGDLDGAAAALRSGLRAVPAGEDLWRDLMRTVAATGDRVALVDLVDEAYRRLGGWDIVPSAETDRLVDELVPGYRSLAPRRR